MRYLFNDGWLFLKTTVGTTLEQAEIRKKEFAPVDIPHDWLIYDSERLYESGTGWYRKSFLWEEGEEKRAFLTFEGIYMDSAVYVNGKKAGEWKYGYSTFTPDITEFLVRGENVIMVSACFRSPNSRWYSGAGIYRDVWLKVTGQTYIKENGIYVSCEKRQKDFILQVETQVCGKEMQVCREEEAGEESKSLAGKEKKEETGGACQVTHRLLYGEEEVPLALLEEEGTVKKYLVKSPRLWDVDSPSLYTLCTTLSREGVMLQEEKNRIGFRETQFYPDKGFYLNGRHLKLNGVCEHHDLGALGAAFNRSAMKRKFRILKEMGVNAVRGTHNMMAPGFVELADEMGILLISEAFDMWEMPKNEFDYARFFKEWAARDVESWVCRDRNHPSVIMWSIGNEIYDTHADDHGQEITEFLMRLVEKYDPRRNGRATIGSNYMPWENAQKCADILKVAGYNYSERYYEKHHKAHPDWIIYGSETSSIVQSRGVYHFPLSKQILSEDDEQCSSLGNSTASWGAKSMEECVTMDRDTPFSMGQFIWSGFDYIGEPTPYQTKNSYFGQIDTAGFPKDSYYVWQSAWTDYRKKPMVHLFPYWDFNPGQLIDVRVCSNAPFVELFLNGKSLGRQQLDHETGSGKHILADYQVLYEEGTLTAAAYDEKGQEIARKEQHSFGNSASISLRAEQEEAKADGRDLLFVEIGALDKDGYPVENACDRVQVEVTGCGRLVGLDNGDSTDFDSYKGKSRRLFNGKLLAVIQTGFTPGEIKVEVSAKGLEGGCLVLRAAEAEANCGLTAAEANRQLPVVMGRADELPVRKIRILAAGGQIFTADKKTLTAEAFLEPANADDQEIFWSAVSDAGVPTKLVSLKPEGNRVYMEAIGDGNFRLRCMSKSGTEKIRLISQLEFSIVGLGQAYLDPYDFIGGSFYTYFEGHVGGGNEKGIATSDNEETVIAYENIDFGEIGSDEITVPIFAFDGEPYPIQIWEGIPGKENSRILADVIYQKPSVWNVYQPETWKLKEMLKGITTVSFLIRQKMHIRGFSFTRFEKAWLRLEAGGADEIYGDSFRITGNAVEEIGNNVSLVFRNMDFGEEGAKRLTIKGRAMKGSNTIHVRCMNGEGESKQIVEFQGCAEYREQSFEMTPVCGKCDVTFVFMPGSCFDFQWFWFQK